MHSHSVLLIPTPVCENSYQKKSYLVSTIFKGAIDKKSVVIRKSKKDKIQFNEHSSPWPVLICLRKVGDVATTLVSFPFS